VFLEKTVKNRLAIIADYFYSILRCDNRCDFFVGVDAVCECDFFRKKRCNV